MGKTIQTEANKTIPARLGEQLVVPLSDFSAQLDQLKALIKAVADAQLTIQSVSQNKAHESSLSTAFVALGQDLTAQTQILGQKSDDALAALNENRTALETHITAMSAPLPALMQQIYEKTLESVETNRVMLAGQLLQQSNELQANIAGSLAGIEAHVTTMTGPQTALIQKTYEQTLEAGEANRVMLAGQLLQQSNELQANIAGSLAGLEAHVTTMTGPQTALIQKTYEQTLEAGEANRVMLAGQLTQQSNELQANIAGSLAGLEAHVTTMTGPQTALIQRTYEQTLEAVEAVRGVLAGQLAQHYIDLHSRMAAGFTGVESHVTTMTRPQTALIQTTYEQTLAAIEGNRVMLAGQFVQQSNELHASLNTRLAQLEAHFTSLAGPQPALIQNTYEQTTQQIGTLREGLMIHVDQRNNELLVAIHERLSNLEAHTTNQTVGQGIPLLIQTTYENLQRLFASNLEEDKTRRAQEAEDMAANLRALNGRLVLVEQNSARQSKILADKIEELTVQLGDRRSGGWPFGKKKQDDGEYVTRATTAPQLLSHED